MHVYLDRMSSNVSVSAVLVSDTLHDRLSSLCALLEFIRSALYSRVQARQHNEGSSVRFGQGAADHLPTALRHVLRQSTAISIHHISSIVLLVASSAPSLKPCTSLLRGA